MDDLTYGLIIILIGIGLVVLKNWLINGSVNFQDRVYGLHFGGKKAEKIYHLLAIVIGLCLIAYGVIILV